MRILFLLLSFGVLGVCQTKPFAISLESLQPQQMQERNVKTQAASFKGRKTLQVTALPSKDGESLLILPESSFADGTIELDVAGEPAAGAPGGARGFVGVAFRMEDNRYECFYIRPTNGRSEDQERRNHSTQYISFPDFPWEKLRKETPSKYESYVDLEPGAWTKLRITVQGEKAKLYVHTVDASAQPVLVVNDLKLGKRKGAIALWVGPGTVAHFSNLVVKAN